MTTFSDYEPLFLQRITSLASCLALEIATKCGRIHFQIANDRRAFSSGSRAQVFFSFRKEGRGSCVSEWNGIKAWHSGKNKIKSSKWFSFWGIRETRKLLKSKWQKLSLAPPHRTSLKKNCVPCRPQITVSTLFSMLKWNTFLITFVLQTYN